MLAINIHKHYIRTIFLTLKHKAYEIRTRKNHENYRNCGNGNTRNCRDITCNKLHSNNEHKQVQHIIATTNRTNDNKQCGFNNN